MNMLNKIRIFEGVIYTLSIIGIILSTLLLKNNKYYEYYLYLVILGITTMLMPLVSIIFQGIKEVKVSSFKSSQFDLFSKFIVIILGVTIYYIVVDFITKDRFDGLFNLFYLGIVVSYIIGFLTNKVLKEKSKKTSKTPFVKNK